MANVAGQGTTFNLPNFVGPLFGLTPTETPLLSMIGGLSGGKSVMSKEHSWQTYDLATAAVSNVLEGADATFAERDRAEVSNVLQIFQYGVELSYTKQAAVNQLGPSSGVSILGEQPVGDEMSWQLQRKVEQAALDVNYTFWNSTYDKPADNATNRQMRGLNAAITTNVVDATATPTAYKTHIDALQLAIWNAGGPMRNPVLFCGGAMKQNISNTYGYAPESRTVGGVNIQTIETDFGPLGVMLDRHVTTTSIYILDLSVIQPVFMQIPGKGHFFLEPLAKSGAADKAQLYGEIGIEYGPQQWHGKIENLTA